MNIFGILAVIFLLAFLVESLVEYLFGKLFENIPAIKPYSWLLMYISAIAGVVGAFLYGFDLLYLLGNYVGIEEFQPTWYGMLLTGLGIGRGAGFLNDLVSKFFTKPKDTRTIEYKSTVTTTPPAEPPVAEDSRDYKQDAVG